MSAKKSPQNHVPVEEPLLYEDVNLFRKYPVVEIAMLAAGCRGETREERITAAVELLALVERYALAGKETRCRILERKRAKNSNDVEDSDIGYSLINKRFQKALEIRDAATRDRKSGKIELTSLVGLAYKATTGGKENSSEVMRRFNLWVAEQAGDEVSAMRSFKALFASGAKLILVHDDDVAIQLGMRFMDYLEKSPKRETPKIIRSKKPESRGQIVSPKTRGSDRSIGDEGGDRKLGQYKQKLPIAMPNHDDSRRANQTRMNGNGSD